MKQILLLTAVAVLGYACAETAVITENENTDKTEIQEVKSPYPAWFTEGGFSIDSLAFSMSATAVAADSIKALERAEEVSRMRLESKLADEIEKIRSNLTQDYSKNAAILVALRMAHALIEEKAVLRESKTELQEGIYRGFAKTEITKMQLNKLLEQGLSGNAGFWKELSSSPSYKKLIGD